MTRDMLVLACDAGGTKTEIELFCIRDKKEKSIAGKMYASSDFNSLEDILLDFISSTPQKASACCVGVPGPVANGVSQATNIPWNISEKNLAETTGIVNCILSNDLEIMAHSLPYLNDDDLICIHKGNEAAREGNKAIIAPGTGLGQALLVERDGARIVIPTEGGHADFAPQDELQCKLLQYLEKLYGRVSIERILSGPGICNIFDFLAEEQGMPVTEDIKSMFVKDDKAKVISESAANRTAEICSATMMIFVSVLGAHSGNVALTVNSTGGIFLAGGIPRQIISLIQNGPFIQSYENKGRLRSYVMNCPVYVITHRNPGLIGAAMLAFDRFQAGSE